MISISSKLVVDEVYLDGKLIKAEEVVGRKGFKIFIHSSPYNYAEVIKINNRRGNIIGDEYKKAIFTIPLQG